jgi:hypothetical protein
MADYCKRPYKPDPTHHAAPREQERERERVDCRLQLWFVVGPHDPHWMLIPLLDCLELGWYRLRTPIGCHYSLSDPQGTLTLYGNAYTILDDECPSMLLRKQMSLSGTWSTLLDFNPTTSTEEAGTAVFWSKWAFMALLVRLGKDRRKEVLLRWTDPDGDDLKVSLTLLTLVPSKTVQPLKSGRRSVSL